MMYPIVVLLGIYAAGFLGLWIYFGYSDHWFNGNDDADDAEGAVFLSLFWPLVLLCAVIYGLFKGLMGIGRLARWLPWAYNKAVIAYYKWKHQ